MLDGGHYRCHRQFNLSDSFWLIMIQLIQTIVHTLKLRCSVRSRKCCPDEIEDTLSNRTNWILPKQWLSDFRIENAFNFKWKPNTKRANLPEMPTLNLMNPLSSNNNVYYARQTRRDASTVNQLQEWKIRTPTANFEKTNLIFAWPRKEFVIGYCIVRL